MYDTDAKRTVEQALCNSMEEVELMRSGKLKKPALESLFEDIRKWVQEDCSEQEGSDK